MSQKVKWERYTLVEDIAVDLDRLKSMIGEPDPVTGCQFQTTGARHHQGYMMLKAYPADQYGEEITTHKGMMVTGHRVLARLKFKQPITPATKVYHYVCGNMACLNADHLAMGTYQDIADTNRLLGKKCGPEKGGMFATELGTRPQMNRKYKYSIEQLLFIKYNPTDLCEQRLKLPRARIQKIKHAFKGNGYRWLDKYDMYKTDDWKEPENITKE